MPSTFGQTSYCFMPQYVADGFCDDETNNQLCNFDGGDCCGLHVIFDFCNECICKDTSTVTVTEMIITIEQTSSCPMSNYVADGFCDDDTNNQLCNFDGGDCCGPYVIFDFCIECICKEDVSTVTEMTITVGQTSSCTMLHYVADGFCDDVTNNHFCDYDGGDCCLEDTINVACEVCKCLDA